MASREPAFHDGNAEISAQKPRAERLGFFLAANSEFRLASERASQILAENENVPINTAAKPNDLQTLPGELRRTAAHRYGLQKGVLAVRRGAQ